MLDILLNKDFSALRTHFFEGCDGFIAATRSIPMNLNFQSIKLGKQPSFQACGFALIATISVMVLLVMIALAMLSLSTLELRSARHSDARLEAQANARMALMLAIGQLQEQMGPDTRVSANASVAAPASPNPYWVGIYKTRPNEDLGASTPVSGKFVIDHHDPSLDKGLFLTDSRVANAPRAITHLIRWA